MSNTYPNFGFDIHHTANDSAARVGTIKTPHGNVETPNFIFCGTKATVKMTTPAELEAENTQFILANTYHLMLRPTAEWMEKMGGLHKVMGWNHPILTDSGGYQVFAMGHGSVSEEIKGKRSNEEKKSVLKIDEDGVTFKSYIDGSKVRLTPESSIDVQRKLGADIILQFDECTAFHVDKSYTAQSMEKSMRWGDRSLAEFMRQNDGKQSVYGIVQGGVYEDLRDISCDFVNDRDFFGIAVGGSLGQTVEQMHTVVSYTMSKLRKDRPVHLLGIGNFVDIFHGVRQGIDTFDCVDPTRRARHGMAKVKGAPKEHINLLNSKYEYDTHPIDETCGCYACKNGFSRGYLRYLFKAQEALGPKLVTLHNIHTMNRLMTDIRDAIRNNTLDMCEKEWTGKASAGNKTRLNLNL